MTEIQIPAYQYKDIEKILSTPEFKDSDITNVEEFVAEVLKKELEKKEDNGKQLSNLTFEDGINLAWDIIFEIINREDDKADNMGGILCDYISEALQKIIDDLSNKRIKQLYKHFNIELN